MKASIIVSACSTNRKSWNPCSRNSAAIENSCDSGKCVANSCRLAENLPLL